jgi:hypothetical protein
MKCTKWRKEIKGNPETLREVRYFKDGPIVQNLVKTFRELLKIDYIDIDIINVIYTACAYETSWRAHINTPWCNLFDENALKIMEYLQDLEYYWIDGYGYEISTKLACKTMENLYQRLE